MVTMTTTEIITLAEAITNGEATNEDANFYWCFKGRVDAIRDMWQFFPEDEWEFDIPAHADNYSTTAQQESK